jgi:hypothetical protein
MLLAKVTVIPYKVMMSASSLTWRAVSPAYVEEAWTEEV